MAEPKRNIGASVRARLLNLAWERKQPFDLLLTRYVLERLLYRLSISKYRDRFVLKGAMLLTTWFDNPLRPTRDLDLLGFGESDPGAIAAAFREVCAVEAGDAVAFDVDGLAIDRIREELEYGGLRIKTTATIDSTRIKSSSTLVSATRSSRALTKSNCRFCSAFPRRPFDRIHVRPSSPKNFRRW